MRYDTKEVSDYNPTTHPPFHTVFYPREKFLDAEKHFEYIHNESHEYVKDFLKYDFLPYRGFIVGCHQDNISTFYGIPFKGELLQGLASEKVLENAGIKDVPGMKFKFGVGKIILTHLPNSVRRKLRYWGGEKKWILRPIFEIIYNFLRS